MKELRIIEIFLGFFVAVTLIIIFRELSAIFIPLLFAILLSFMFGPLVRKLAKYKIPKAIVLTILMLIIFIVFELLGILVYTGLQSFVEEIPKYTIKMTELLRNITSSEKIRIPDEDVKNFIKNINWQSIVNPGSVTSIISGTMGSFTNFIGKIILVLIFMLFSLSGRSKLHQRLARSLSPKKSKQTLDIINSIEGQVQKYLVTKTLISFVTGLLGLVVLAIMGVDFVILFGLLIFVLNFIPTIGSIVATVIPVLVAFFEFGFSWRVIVVGLLLITIQMTLGNYVEPKLMGRGLNLSPMVILISLIFWGWVWGIIGMILAVPMTSAMKIVFEHIEPLRPVAAIMSEE